MAKETGVNMSITIGQVQSMSESQCLRLYRNYHCEGNSLGVTPEAMGYISVKYESKIAIWQSTMSDVNEYDFDDSDYRDFYDEGRELVKQSTGHSGSTAGQTARTTVDAIGAGAAATTSILGGGATVLNGVAGTIAGKGAGVWGGLAGTAGKVCAYVSAALVIAQAAMYQLLKPNKEGKEACDVLQNEMANAQAALTDTQNEMAAIIEEVDSLSTEAGEVVDNANNEILLIKTSYDYYARTHAALLAKSKAGTPLTQSEVKMFNECVYFMGLAGGDIGDASDSASSDRDSIYGDMETFQAGYDYAAETMAEIAGITDFAAQIDDATQNSCYTENMVQNVNFATGMVTGARLIATSSVAWWNIAIGAATVAAALVSKTAAAEQKDWAGQIGNEIALRQSTENFNAATNEIYTEDIDIYSGLIQGVGSLEIFIPQETGPATQTSLPTNTAKPTTPNSGSDKKDKEEK